MGVSIFANVLHGFCIDPADIQRRHPVSEEDDWTDPEDWIYAITEEYDQFLDFELVTTAPNSCLMTNETRYYITHGSLNSTNIHGWFDGSKVDLPAPTPAQKERLEKIVDFLVGPDGAREFGMYVVTQVSN